MLCSPHRTFLCQELQSVQTKKNELLDSQKFKASRFHIVIIEKPWICNLEAAQLIKKMLVRTIKLAFEGCHFYWLTFRVDGKKMDTIFSSLANYPLLNIYQTEALHWITSRLDKQIQVLIKAARCLNRPREARAISVLGCLTMLTMFT